MQRIKEKLKQIQLPINSGTLGLFISLLAVGYVASAVQSPCLQAQATCAVGGESVFNENIQIKGGTTYAATLDASGITSDRTITIPNASGTILLGGGLSGQKVVATDVSGELTTTEIYPLSIGTSGEVLTVDATNSFLEYSSITGVPTLTASKSVATDGTGALTTTDVYPLSLTASTPLKTNVSGEVTASDLDITTDITAGTSLQQIRTNAGGTALEFFTPSGGGDYTKVASGNMVVSTADSAMVIACWYGQHTLDPTKEYTLHIDSGTVSDALTTNYNKFRAQKNDCSSGGGLEFDSINASMWSVGGRMANTTSNIVSASYCYGVGGGVGNSTAARASNIAGRFNFRAWEDDTGLNLDWTLTGVNYNSSNVPYGIQAGTGSCINHDNTKDFNTITGIHTFLEGNGDTTRTWALYETDI